MFEVEVKVRAVHADVRPTLESRDAEPLGVVEQVDTYYDAPHRDFAETDEALRIRRERAVNGGQRAGTGNASDRDEQQETVELTYKGPLLEAASKSREEEETAVTDGEAAAAILANLGFEPAAEVRKERERFELDGYTVTLDSVDGLGEFVEVETESTDEDISAARDGCRDLLASLGLDPDEQIRTSYLGLLLAAGDSQ